MRKFFAAFFIVFVITIGICATVIALNVKDPPEPIYKSKPLTAWIEDSYCNGNTSGEWVKAVHQSGGDSIPHLLLLLQSHDSPWKLKFMNLCKKPHFIHIHFISAELKQQAAREGFSELGRTARKAVPELVKIYDKNVSASSQRAVVSTIIEIGPSATNAIPDLVRWLRNANGETAELILVALTKTRSQPMTIVPILTAGLRNDSAPYRATSARLLEYYGNDAKTAVPNLLLALQDPDGEVRYAAAYTLKSINPEAAAKAGLK